MANNSKDFEKAFEEIKKKRPRIDLLSKYVNGGQPLKYSTERLEEAFDNITTRFEINWCSVIVDTALDRIELNGFDTGKDKAANDALDSIFDKLHIDLEADRAHKGALSFDKAYVMVWKTETGEIQVYYNDPRLCHVFYVVDNPREKRYAAKWMRRDDKKHEIILYYPDRLEHYLSKSNRDDISNPNDFELEVTEVNTFKVIPVFELSTDSEIVKVTSIQDAINKTFADLMVSNEFGSWAQRWVISNGDPGDLKNGPNMVWYIPSGDGAGQGSSVGQFQSTPPTGFLDTMDRLASDMFVISRTPKHYMFNAGANISGEALLAMEAPLSKKVDKHKKRFTATWQDIGAFILQLQGITKEPSEITIVWSRTEAIQPYTEAQTMQLAVNTGIPLETFLKRQGWTEQELKDLQDDMKKAKENSRSLGQSVLDSLRVQDQQSNVVAESIGDNRDVNIR